MTTRSLRIIFIGIFLGFYLFSLEEPKILRASNLSLEDITHSRSPRLPRKTSWAKALWSTGNSLFRDRSPEEERASYERYRQEREKAAIKFGEEGEGKAWEVSILKDSLFPLKKTRFKLPKETEVYYISQGQLCFFKAEEVNYCGSVVGQGLVVRASDQALLYPLDMKEKRFIPLKEQGNASFVGFYKDKEYVFPIFSEFFYGFDEGFLLKGSEFPSSWKTDVSFYVSYLFADMEEVIKEDFLRRIAKERKYIFSKEDSKIEKILDPSKKILWNLKETAS